MSIWGNFFVDRSIYILNCFNVEKYEKKLIETTVGR